MTKAQAAELRTIWEQRGDPQPCDHPNQELENSEDGYLTGAYHCLTCGECIKRCPRGLLRLEPIYTIERTPERGRR
jgi:ferredoxin